LAKKRSESLDRDAQAIRDDVLPAFDDGVVRRPRDERRRRAPGALNDRELSVA